MFPLLMGPTYVASGGDPMIYYATIAGILSGAVAGDHVSPIPDTTVLSALATDCNLLKHVATQLPYVLWICLFSILIGTLPVGYDAYPNGVAYLLGYILILGFVFGICRPIVAKNGSFDPFTELYLRFNPDSPLHELKHATAQAYDSMVVNTDGGKMESRGTVPMMSSLFFCKKNNDGSAAVGTKGEEQPLAVVDEDMEDLKAMEEVVPDDTIFCQERKR